MNARFAAVIGLDVGKTGHHACALDPDGNRLFDKPLPQDEAQLRDLFTHLQEHGDVLMVVDQPNTIEALPIAVARDVGCAVAYLPGLAMRKAADLYPDRSKTDARDAFIIADTARTMPHTLRTIDRDSDVLSALTVLAGFDEDLAHETTRALNRIRSLLTQIHPADPEVLVNQIFTALSEQTVVVPATASVELVIPRVAGQVKELKEQRATMAREGRGYAGGLLSRRGLDEHAGDRHQDRPDPPGLRRWLRIRDRRPSCSLHRRRAGHAKIRDLDQERVVRLIRQQTPEERAVLLRVGRLGLRSDLQGLLRPEARREKPTPRRRHLPRPPPLQRHPRDAPQRHLLPAPTTTPSPEPTGREERIGDN